MGRGSNKLSKKEALPQAQNPINLNRVFLTQECIHVASSLKPLTQT